MRVLLDMNLSPMWAAYLIANGIEAVHWSGVGDKAAPDSAVLEWALRGGFVVFTHDLDLGTIIALTGASGPSVIQIRTQAVLPDQIGALMVSVLHQSADLLTRGAIVTVDEVAARIRVLPIGGRSPSSPC